MSAVQGDRWAELRPLAEAGNVDALLGAIGATSDVPERIGLYRATIRHLAWDPWQNKNLDVMTALADAAIADCELAGGDLLEQANIICFNTSANLADCWEDAFSRERRHFEKGAEYARKALWYREHMGKGPDRIAMAMWALAKHQQSLGAPEATDTYRRCLELETEAAVAAGKPAEITAGASAGYLIAAGYLALVEDRVADLGALKEVLDAMEAEGGEPREEAEIIRKQINATAKNMHTTPPL